MSAPTFKCPGCWATLDKPAELFVKGEVRDAGAYSVSLGGPDQGTLDCPRCSAPISKRDIVAGKHDLREPGPLLTPLNIAIAAALALIALYLVKAS